MFPLPEYHSRSTRAHCSNIAPIPARGREEYFDYFNLNLTQDELDDPVPPVSTPIDINAIEIPNGPLFFDSEPTPKSNQGVQTDAVPNAAHTEDREDAVNAENVTNTTTEKKGVKNPLSHDACQNSIVINIGTLPQPVTITQNDGITPPAIPLPILPTPDGISIPPPPQESNQAAGAQNPVLAAQNGARCCGNCCKNVNRTYLIYSAIAVCASLTIALVPSLVTVFVKK